MTDEKKNEKSDPKAETNKSVEGKLQSERGKEVDLEAETFKEIYSVASNMVVTDGRLDVEKGIKVIGVLKSVTQRLSTACIKQLETEEKNLASIKQSLQKNI